MAIRCYPLPNGQLFYESLACFQLQELCLENGGVSISAGDVKGLKHFTSLVSLTIDTHCPVDLAPLQSLSVLSALYLDSNDNALNLNAMVQSCSKLQVLQFNNCQVSELRSQSLKELSLHFVGSRTALPDPSFLPSLVAMHVGSVYLNSSYDPESFLADLLRLATSPSFICTNRNTVFDWQRIQRLQAFPKHCSHVCEHSGLEVCICRAQGERFVQPSYLFHRHQTN